MDEIYTVKGNLCGQSIYYKRKHLLEKVAQVDKIYTIKSGLEG